MPTVAETLQAARSEDAGVRQQAAMRLGASTLSSDDPRPEAVAAELVELMIAEPDEFVEETLVWAVVAHRRWTLAPLLTRLDAHERTDWNDGAVSADTQLVRILHTLSKIEDPTTAVRVAAYAHDDRRPVQAKAWWALARMRVPETLPLLLSHVGESDTERRVALARAMIGWGLPALPWLAALLNDRAPAVREHAADLMLRILDPASRGTGARRRQTSTQRELIETASSALVSATAPEVHQSLVQASLEFQDPDLVATAEELLQRRRR